jgi:hypothetical protein
VNDFVAGLVVAGIFAVSLAALVGVLALTVG